MHLGGQQANKLKGHLRDISHGLNLPHVQSISYVKLKSVSLGRFEASDPKGTYHGAEISDSKASLLFYKGGEENLSLEQSLFHVVSGMDFVSSFVADDRSKELIL